MSNSKKNIKYNKLISKRLKIFSSIFIFAIVVIFFQITRLMIIKKDEYSSRAKKVQYAEEVIMPTRGTIYDSSGKELAVSMPVYDFWIELGKVDKSDENINKLVDTIISVLKKEDKNKLREKFKKNVPRLILAQNVSLDDMKKLKEKKISQTWFDEKNKRQYPYGNFASHVLGHTSQNNVGLAGIEASMDLELKGIPGKRIYLKDGNQEKISVKDEMYQKEISGKTVMLTIDEVLQKNLEKCLNDGYYQFAAKSVTGIVMETKTGNILAMATVPSYNPNNPRSPSYESQAKLIKEAKTDEDKMKEIYKMWRNPSVNTIFEPGSPFKVITASAAIEENKVKGEEYFVDNGYIEVAGIKLRNWTNIQFGTITFRKAIEQSVNSVFVQVGQRLGAGTLIDYANAFGFGKRTNISLPGEESGYVRAASSIGPVELANMSYGQGISVTPIQLITAINAIGNNGKLLEPNIVKAILDDDKNIISKAQTKTVKQVISSQTANKILSYMEDVVNGGSGKKAYIEGYRIAGKTGTANKVIEGEKTYSTTKFICSFAAIAPVEDPQVTILVVIDEPMEGTQSGSESAAPIAGNILNGTLKYLGINQTVKIDSKNSQKTVQVPDLKNKSYKEAIEIIKANSLEPVFEQGIVVEEKSHVVSTFPSAGEKVEPNSKVVLYMKSDANNNIKMPNLTNMTREQAQDLLENMGLKYDFIGTGKVVKQIPKAGVDVDIDFRVSVELK